MDISPLNDISFNAAKRPNSSRLKPLKLSSEEVLSFYSDAYDNIALSLKNDRKDRARTKRGLKKPESESADKIKRDLIEKFNERIENKRIEAARLKKIVSQLKASVANNQNELVINFPG